MESATKAQNTLKCRAKKVPAKRRGPKVKSRAKATATETAHWNDRLKKMGLGMDSGRHTWLDYGHMVHTLDFDGKVAYVPPTGESLEQEWPVSLV